MKVHVDIAEGTIPAFNVPRDDVLPRKPTSLFFLSSFLPPCRAVIGIDKIYLLRDDETGDAEYAPDRLINER